MPRSKNASQYENHQRASESHEHSAHVHLIAEEGREKADHQTGHERSRNALEHSPEARELIGQMHPTFNHQDTADLAYTLWEARGRPNGSADEDWFNAVSELRTRAQRYQS